MKPLYQQILHAGRNPSFEFDSVLFIPINLFIQPNSHGSDYSFVQLELVTKKEDPDSYTTFLWNNKLTDGKNTNYPMALGRHLVSLNIANSEISLVVDRLNIGQHFFLEAKQKAIIEDLTLTFKDCTTEFSTDPLGKQLGCLSTFTIEFLHNSECTEFTFTDSYARGNNTFDWMGYRIVFLGNSEKALQIMIITK